LYMRMIILQGALNAPAVPFFPRPGAPVST
jgi:hypothetical protein